MESSILGLIELLLIVGLVFGFGFWQLYTLPRDRRDRPRPEPRRNPEHEDPGAPDDDHAH